MSFCSAGGWTDCAEDDAIGVEDSGAGVTGVAGSVDALLEVEVTGGL